MQPGDFNPWAEEHICVRCLKLVRFDEAVAVVNAENLSGLAHRECEPERQVHQNTRLPL